MTKQMTEDGPMVLTQEGWVKPEFVKAIKIGDREIVVKK